MRLQDKIILITSAQNPCAKALTLGFAREGANCVIADDDAGKAEQLAADVRSLGRRALALEVDVTKNPRLRRLSGVRFRNSDGSMCCSIVQGSPTTVIS